ncbi:MAG: hypothetical protein WCB68_05575 [Pyrinomonadaceae bacterium]
MTNEEMQKILEFVVEQQAQFAVNLQKLAEAQTRTENNVSELTKDVSELAKAQAQTARAQQHLSEVIAAMAEAQERMAKAQEHTDGKIAETDDCLNALINTVERYISERRNGDATK